MRICTCDTDAGHVHNPYHTLIVMTFFPCRREHHPALVAHLVRGTTPKSGQPRDAFTTEGDVPFRLTLGSSSSVRRRGSA